ncbi:MAG: Omp28-related outer membrane protein [Bacteroidetes bacterium]|nr:Omp28-related outer membrane protein [Bacteroidota bacterium]
MKSVLLASTLSIVSFLAACGPDNGSDIGTPEELATVPKSYLGLLTKHTGTRCHFCGTWGWDAMEIAQTQLKDKAVIYAVMGNHDFAEYLVSEFSTELDEFCKIEAYPTFLVNIKTDRSPWGSDENLWGQVVIDDSETLIDSLAAKPITINGAYQIEIKDGKAFCEANFRFFEDVDGEYYGTIWLDESKMVAPQDGYEGPDPEHHHVLRTATTASVFGEEIAKGKIVKDHFVQRNWQIDLDESWKTENLEASVLIFKKERKEWIFVNASKATF